MAYRATRAYIEAFVSALSSRSDITFVEGNQWGVNLKEKKFMYDPVLLQSATIDEVKGILIHEVGHLNYTQDVPKNKESEWFNKYPSISMLYNAFEDIRIEHLMIQEYRSFADGPIAETRFYASLNNYEHVIANKHQGMRGFPAFAGTLMTGLTYYDQRPLVNLSGDGSWLPLYDYISSYSRETYNRMVKYKAPDMKAANLQVYFKKIRNLQEFIPMIDKCENTLEVMQLVDKEIVPQIEDLLKEEEKQRKAGQAMAEALHGAMKKMMGNGKGKGKPKKGEGKDGRSEFAKNGFKGERSLLDDLIKGSVTGSKVRVATPLEDSELLLLNRMNIYALTKHLKSILEERTTIKYAGAYKRGKLLPRNVYKARTNEPRMYSKRKHFDTVMYEVSFLMDESGSMGSGSRYEDIYQAGFVINQAVKNLKFKVNYVGFDDIPKDYKTFEKMRDYRGGGNDEDRVLKHIEKKLDYNNDQIIFLLTDGGVAPSNSPTEMLAKFKKQGVHVIPIGINIPPEQEKEFKRWYPESVLIKNMDSLVVTMAGFLKRIIHR